MLVHFRKCLSLEFVNQVNAVVVQQMLGVESAEAEEEEQVAAPPASSAASDPSEQEDEPPPPNQGQLTVPR